MTTWDFREGWSSGTSAEKVLGEHVFGQRERLDAGEAAIDRAHDGADGRAQQHDEDNAVEQRDQHQRAEGAHDGAGQGIFECLA